VLPVSNFFQVQYAPMRVRFSNTELGLGVEENREILPDRFETQCQHVFWARADHDPISVTGR
jgi:hypothetical protein